LSLSSSTLSDRRHFLELHVLSCGRLQFNFTDVASTRRTVVVAERVVEVRYGHDPNARVTYWRLDEAPETAVDQHETVGGLPDEQICAS